MQTWPPLLTTLLSALFGALFAFMLSFIFRSSGRRTDWYKSKDDLDIAHAGQIRDLERDRADYREWRRDMEQLVRNLQASLNSVDHRIEMNNRRIADIDRQCQKTIDLDKRLSPVEEKMNSIYRLIEESFLEQFKQRH